jgi:hypothetical protein
VLLHGSRTRTSSPASAHRWLREEDDVRCLQLQPSSIACVEERLGGTEEGWALEKRDGRGIRRLARALAAWRRCWLWRLRGCDLEVSSRAG